MSSFVSSYLLSEISESSNLVDKKKNKRKNKKKKNKKWCKPPTTAGHVGKPPVTDVIVSIMMKIMERAIQYHYHTLYVLYFIQVITLRSLDDDAEVHSKPF
jgi:hypothetical protein